MRLKKSIIVPIVLLAYLAVMARIGWKQYSAGMMSAMYYFGVIVLSAVAIVLLHFSLKRRERLRSGGTAGENRDGRQGEIGNN